MARTAPAATPGTNPSDSTAASALSQAAGLDKSTVDAKDDADLDTTPGADETADEKVARLERQMEEMRALIHQMGKNQAVASAEPVKLPSMKTVQGQKPNIPVLTEDGWYVPAVHPTDRVAKN